MKVGIVVPHIFMQQTILPKVIFSPGQLAIDLAEGLGEQGIEAILYTPGPVATRVQNPTADLTYFNNELAIREDNALDLLKKHPLTFITLARQVQSELIAQAFAAANRDELDIVHIYTNEEDIALPFALLCTKPVVFTHHDPFNFLVNYRSVFPKYKQLNWLSISLAQRQGMPKDTNWLDNIYHGLPKDLYKPAYPPASNYIAYMGRVIHAKGVHLAIKAIQEYNKTAQYRYILKIAGKHYSGNKDSYWQQQIAPHIDGVDVQYVGFIENAVQKQDFLGGAAALIVPSVFEEPFGMVMIEALACATPVIGLKSGAIAEVLSNDKTGILVGSPVGADEHTVAYELSEAIANLGSLDRRACRKAFEERFTLERMCREHAAAYKSLQNH